MYLTTMCSTFFCITHDGMTWGSSSGYALGKRSLQRLHDPSPLLVHGSGIISRHKGWPCGRIALAVLLPLGNCGSFRGLGPLPPPERISAAFAVPDSLAAVYHQPNRIQGRRRRRPQLMASAGAALFDSAADSIAVKSANSMLTSSVPDSENSPAAESAKAVTTMALEDDGIGISIIGKRLPGPGLDRDAAHMLRALELASKGLGHTRPNPAVGCIIVDKDGIIVGEGFHPRAGEPHAEVWAIRQAGARARGGTAYVTLEPCNHFGRTPPCTAALLDSGVSRVVAGMVDPDPRTGGGGLRRLAEAGIDVSVGVEGLACQALNSAFVHRISEKACYGVLHCALGGQDMSRLDDVGKEPVLTLTSGGHDYDEYDAIVVEGRSGVAKLETCLHVLPRTALRVIIVKNSGDIERELGPVQDSRLWADSPERSIVIVTAAEGKTKGVGPVRAALTARGVAFIEFSPDVSVHRGHGRKMTGPSEVDTPVDAVARELYRRGLLSAVWDVSPQTALKALEGGHIQRAFVRRRVAKHRNGGAGLGVELVGVGNEEEAAVRTIGRLARKEGVRMRSDKPRRRGERSEDFIEILLPVSGSDSS